jgi:hypothetical protein
MRRESFPVFVTVTVVSLCDPTATLPKDILVRSIVRLTAVVPVPVMDTTVGDVAALLVIVRFAEMGPEPVGVKRIESSNEAPGASTLDVMLATKRVLELATFEMLSVSVPGFVILIARDLLEPTFTFPNTSEDLSVSIAAAPVPLPVTNTVSGP